MKFSLALIILVFCIPAVFVSAKQIPVIIWITVSALLIGIVGSTWPLYMPQNFLTDHPWVANSPFHPALSAFWGGISMLFALGLTLAMICRFILGYFGILKIK